MIERLIDFSDRKQKRLFVEHIESLKGIWRWSLTKYRERRSDKQNGYYFGVLVPIFGDWCRETAGYDWTDDEAHDHLRRRFLTKEETDKNGEIWETTESTSNLDTMQFSKYQEQVVQFLTAFCEIENIPEPDPFYKEKRHGKTSDSEERRGDEQQPDRAEEAQAGTDGGEWL
jgi:hypothetical protein